MRLHARGDAAGRAFAVSISTWALMAVFVTGAGTAQAHREVYAPVRMNYYDGYWFSPRHDFASPEEALQFFKSRLDGCNSAGCVSMENVHPYIHPQIIQWNGVAQWWHIDRRRCPVNQPCVVDANFVGFLAEPRCPEGGKPTFSSIKQLNSDYYRRDVVCMAWLPDVQTCDGTTDCGKGNPILPATGQKIQREVDYASASSGLRFERTYRSLTNGMFSSPATARFVDNTPLNGPLPGCFPSTYTDPSGRIFNDCRPYRSNGTQTYEAHFADGRFRLFSGAPAAITSKADVRDKLSQRTNPSGSLEWVLQREDDSTEIYNTQGVLVRRTSLGGREDISYSYSNGLLASMADRFGRELSFTYDSDGRMATMTDPAGGVFQYGYDQYNNLASVTYPDGVVRQYHYEPQHTGCTGTSVPRNMLTGISENGQRLSTYKYECGSGAALSTEQAGGVNKYSFQYFGYYLGIPSSEYETDPLGTQRSHQHSQIQSFVRRTSTTQPAASGTGTVFDSVQYDANGNVSRRKDFNGNWTNYDYDLSRNLETRRRDAMTSSGTTTPLTRTVTTEWHPTFRLPTRIAEPLRITTTVYDADGTQCGAAGMLCSRSIQATTDANGSLGFSATPTGTPRTWSYTYNANGAVLTVNGPRTDVSDVTTYTYYADDDADLGKRGNIATITNSVGHRTDITAYNAHGQPTRIVDANAMVATLEYDARRRLISRNVGGEVTSYNYSPLGELIRVTLPDGSYLNYGNDAAQRLTEISDNLGNRIVYTLDNIGNRITEEVRDPANLLAQKRSRVYNALNRLFKELGAQNQTTEYAYDNQGNAISVKDPLNHITTNQFDALHRLKQVTDPGSGVTTYEYNGLDALTKVTDPRNLATTYNLNGLGNLTSQVSPDTGITANTYDAAGNLATQTDTKGQITSYAYDPLNRVSSIAFHDGAKQIFSYDAGINGIGRLTGINELNPGQAVIASIAYGYDQKGRLTSDTRTISGVGYTTGYRYDSPGRMDRITYPSGRTVDYSFDSLGRVSAVNTKPAGGTASSIASAVTYHPFGGVKSYTLGNGQSYMRSFDQDGRITSYTLGGATYSVGYDAASRIEFITETANPTNSNNYGYDVLDRLTSANTPGTNYAYSYDAVGNRLSKAAGAGTDIYAYTTTSNRIMTITPSSGPVRSFSLDANGSTTADGINTYSYDVRGRMISATSSIGTTSYQVNALGQRVRKTNSAGDRIFTYDTKGHLIAESTAVGTTLKEYVWLGDIPLAVIDSNGGGYFAHVDHLNTPRLIADATGTTVWRWDQQEPFGNSVPDENPSGLGVFDLPLRLPGQYFDRETNLHYNYFRNYDPSIGRYEESDPIGLLGGLNTYAYVSGQPLTGTDPEGLRRYGPDNDPYPHCAHDDFMCRGGFQRPTPTCCDDPALAACLAPRGTGGMSCVRCVSTRGADRQACVQCARTATGSADCYIKHCGPDKCPSKTSNACIPNG